MEKNKNTNEIDFISWLNKNKGTNILIGKNYSSIVPCCIGDVFYDKFGNSFNYSLNVYGYPPNLDISHVNLCTKGNLKSRELREKDSYSWYGIQQKVFYSDLYSNEDRYNMICNSSSNVLFKPKKL